MSSRATKIRSAIAKQLREKLGADPEVTEFSLFRYDRDDVKKGLRVMIRVGDRRRALEHGYTPRDVDIDVGVAGVVPKHSEGTEFNDHELKFLDSIDGQIEGLMDLWDLNGPLDVGLEDHYPTELTMTNQVDTELLKTSGIYFSTFRVTYRDAQDEYEES